MLAAGSMPDLPASKTLADASEIPETNAGNSSCCYESSTAIAMRSPVNTRAANGKLNKRMLPMNIRSSSGIAYTR